MSIATSYEEVLESKLGAERARIAELREAARPFLPPHMGTCIDWQESTRLAQTCVVTRKSCQCRDEIKRLRTALEAW